MDKFMKYVVEGMGQACGTVTVLLIAIWMARWLLPVDWIIEVASKLRVVACG